MRLPPLLRRRRLYLSKMKKLRQETGKLTGTVRAPPPTTLVPFSGLRRGMSFLLLVLKPFDLTRGTRVGISFGLT